MRTTPICRQTSPVRLSQRHGSTVGRRCGRGREANSGPGKGAPVGFGTGAGRDTLTM